MLRTGKGRRPQPDREPGRIMNIIARLEPPLTGDLENAYRRNYLETDLRFARLGIGFFLCSLFWP